MTELLFNRHAHDKRQGNGNGKTAQTETEKQSHSHSVTADLLPQPIFRHCVHFRFPYANAPIEGSLTKRHP